MKEHGAAEKRKQMAKLKQAAEVFRQGQAQLKRAQMAEGEQAQAELEACAGVLTEAIALRPGNALYYQTRGRCFLAMQQYQRALADFSMCVRIDPSTSRHFGQRGLCFRRLGRVEEALSDYDDALALEKLRPDGNSGDTHWRQAADYYFERALVHMDLEIYEKAIEGFGLALEKGFTVAGLPYKAHFHRGICFRKLGRLTDSIDSLRQAITLEPQSAEAHNHLGLSYVEEGAFEEAKKYFTSAVEHDSCARYLNNCGLAYYHLQQYKEALGDFTTALEREPDDAAIHFNRGNAHFQLGQHEEALVAYGKAIQLHPENAVYLYHMGLAHQGCGHVRDAIARFEETLKRDPEYHTARFHLGLMCHADSQIERSLRALCQVPEDAALHEARGLVYRDLRDYPRALADFDAVLQMEPEMGRHFYNRGMIFHQMGLGEEAINDFSRALELGCADAAVYSERGLAWRSLGNLAQAVVDLGAAVQLDPKWTPHLSNRAQCLFEQGLYDRAEADLSRALLLDPSDPALLHRRGITHYSLQHYAEAVVDLKAALQCGPQTELLPDIYYHLGVSFANLSKHSLAVAAYDKAIGCAPENRPHYIHERAKSLQVTGDHSRALEDFEAVLRLQPTNARALFRCGFSLKAQGQYTEAAEAFESAKEYAPDDLRMVINYRKVYSVDCISLGPCGHEDPLVAPQITSPKMSGESRVCSKQ
jgi:tetratricopeptide (TPR) repeat protein